MTPFVLDTETAGLDGGVCDLALVKVDYDLNVLWEVESLIDPERPISPSASGIHHITDDMVQFEPTLSEFMGLHSHPFKEGPMLFIGHNVKFDLRMLKDELPESYCELCTLKLARMLWPEAPDHKLQTLRYMFKLDAGTAHRAMGDVITCLNLIRMVAHEHDTDLQGVYEMARKPMPLSTKMPFGKHKGVPLSDVPKSYVRWLLDSAEIDPDLREALSQRIN